MTFSDEQWREPVPVGLDEHWLAAHRYLRRADGTRRLHVFRNVPFATEAMLMAFYRPHENEAATERARHWLGEAWQPWQVQP